MAEMLYNYLKKKAVVSNQTLNKANWWKTTKHGISENTLSSILRKHVGELFVPVSLRGEFQEIIYRNFETLCLKKVKYSLFILSLVIVV